MKNEKIVIISNVYTLLLSLAFTVREFNRNIGNILMDILLLGDNSMWPLLLAVIGCIPLFFFNITYIFKKTFKTNNSKPEWYFWIFLLIPLILIFQIIYFYGEIVSVP